MGSPAIGKRKESIGEGKDRGSEEGERVLGWDREGRLSREAHCKGLLGADWGALGWHPFPLANSPEGPGVKTDLTMTPWSPTVCPLPTWACRSDRGQAVGFNV